MDRILDDRLKHIIKTGLDPVKPDAQEEERCLAEIHWKIKERSGVMKFNKKKMIAVFSAVFTIMVMGTVTAVAAGKITSLVSSADRSEDVYSKDELVRLAGKQMGTVPKLVDGFSNGMAFKEGNITKVEGEDEDQNALVTYPEVYASYGENDKVSLSVHEQQDLIPQESHAVKQQEIYQDIRLEASEDNCLFLPPDAKPSEEDLKLQEEGKLMISYGSSEEERKVFRYVSWSENGMDYMLYTFADMDLNDLTGMAKEVINAK